MFERTAGRIVYEGKVFCSWRDRDVEADLCLACPELLRIRETKDRTTVECRGLPAPVGNAFGGGL